MLTAFKGNNTTEIKVEMDTTCQDRDEIKWTNVLHTKRTKPLLLASCEYRINHPPASLGSMLGPKDRGNKTSPWGTHCWV